MLDSPPPNLDAADWPILEDCVTILKPFEKITTILSAESYPTLSSVIPLVRGLQSSLMKKAPNTEAGRGRHLQHALLEVVDRRLSVYETNRTAAKATILEPRFKKAFGIESTAENAVKYVLEELAYNYHMQLQPINQEERNYQQQPPPTATTHEASSSASTRNDDDIWEHFDKKVNESNKNIVRISSFKTIFRSTIFRSETRSLAILGKPETSISWSVPNGIQIFVYTRVLCAFGTAFFKSRVRDQSTKKPT